MRALQMIFISSILIYEGVSDKFKIGGIFKTIDDNTNKSMEQLMFEIAVQLQDYVSEPDSQYDRQLILVPHIANIEHYNSLRTEHEVCDMLSDSVIAIFGPENKETIPIVRSVCDVKEIPHIQARYDPQQRRSTCGINLYPHPNTLSKAYTDVIRKLGWTSFIILYEDNISLIRISDLLRPERNLSVQVKQLSVPNDYRDVFRYIIKSEESNILLDCSIDKLPEILRQAQQIGAMIAKYNYIITCLDLHTIDLEPYKYSGVKIFGFRLVNPSKSWVNKTLSEIEGRLQEAGYGDPEKVLAEAALIYDSVNLFKKTLQEKYLALPLLQTTNGDPNETKMKYISDNNVPRCYDENSWKFGFSIISDMKITEMKGLSGLIKFDYEGFRSNIELQIIELTESGLREKGIWNTSQGDRMTFIDDPQPTNLHDFKNTTFNIIFPMTKPYGMRKRSAYLLEGNERFEGYAVDLLHELSVMYGFKYELLSQEDGSNGSPITTKNGTVWDGMIGAVLNHTADMAIGDLTVTKERTVVVEFSSPFMELGIAILFMKPEKENPSLFSFLFPFSDAVWFLVITASFGMALLLYIMARLSPYEWTNPYPCIPEPEALENQFTFSNAMWFTMAALMQQGSDVAPISPSTRIAAGVWWFFTLIMVSSYTANLAAFLTVENDISPFSDAYELSRQTKIGFGAKKKGATESFFKDSDIPEYHNIYEYMTSHPDMMTDSNEGGVEKVLKSAGSYAFFMESSAIEYEKEQHCEFAQIGPLLDSKNYGIAMRKDAWYVKDISNGILQLQEQGVLTSLKRKWWKEKYSKNCQEDKKNDADTLKLANVGGVFLVLIVGVGIALLIVAAELIYNLKTSNRQQSVPFKRELARELKFILNRKSVKPTLKPDENNLLSGHIENNLVSG